MNPSILDTINRTLESRAATVRGRLNAARKGGGTYDRVGGTNVKTGTVSTYREVGATCPTSCPFLEAGCYAQGGNVNLHQRASTGGALVSGKTAAAAMATGAALDMPARLHVSGDFGLRGNSDTVDVAYVLHLADIGAELEARGFEGPFAWAYTHFPRETFEPFADMLRGLVTIVYSDFEGPGGAIVLPHGAPVRKLRKRRPDLKVVQCPAQTSDGAISCRDCGFCFDDPEGRGRLIVFDPHGSREAALRARFE